MDAAPSLRARLHAWSPDDSAAAFAFTARLARDNRWPEAFAARVVAEYRRFIELYVTAGHPVTPSDEVDQAWHLHLLYTHDYWGPFCAEVTQTPIHHGPTRGGVSEHGKFEDWYARTLESYERTFGETPPADIWPPAETRFARARTFTRINTADVWLVPKRPVRRGVRAALAGGIALTLLGGCAGVVMAGGSGTIGWFFAALLVLILFGALRGGRRRKARIQRLEREIKLETDPKNRALLEARLIRMKKRGGGGDGSGGWFGWGGCGGCGGCGGGGCGGCGGCGG